MRSSRAILIVVSALALVALTAGCSRGAASSERGLSTADKAASAAGDSSATASDAAAIKNQTGTDASATVGGSAAAGTGSSASGTGSKTTKGALPVVTTTSGMKVRLVFWNDTSSKPLKGTEIVAGSSSFKPGTTSKNVRGATVALPYGKVVQLVVYPDGRTGKKITVPIMVSKDMSPNSEQDAIHIAISDGSVRILGNPVNSVDQTVPRF